MASQKNQEVDILIIGAGPAGTVAASILQKKGYRIKIVEKELFPRFVIGESLLPRCMESLEKAGFIESIEKIGFQKKYGAKFVWEHAVCDFDFSNQYTSGWNWTWQVQRAQFDQLLANEVAKNGVEVEYESTVTSVQLSETGHSTIGVTPKTGLPYQVEAKFLVDSSGYGRVLARLLALDIPSNSPARTSLFCHLKPGSDKTKGEERITILVHSKNVWGWIIPFADGASSIGIVGEAEEVNQYPGNKEEQIRQWIQRIPALKEKFNHSEIIMAPRSITGYSCGVKSLWGRNFVLTGNSADFIDPVFSSGVTLAVESSARAAELIDRQLSGETVEWEKEYTHFIKRGVSVFQSFVDNWYNGNLPKIFFHEPANPIMKKQICSILAGYVWDLDNPFVKKHGRAIEVLASIL